MSITQGDLVRWSDITNFYQIFNRCFQVSQIEGMWGSVLDHRSWSPSGGGQGNLVTAATRNAIKPQMREAKYVIKSGTKILNTCFIDWTENKVPADVAVGDLIKASALQKSYNRMAAHQNPSCAPHNGGQIGNCSRDDTSEGCSNDMD